jgi:hypothetical protein
LQQLGSDLWKQNPQKCPLRFRHKQILDSTV